MIWSPEADHITSNFFKVVFHKLYLVHPWIHWPTYYFFNLQAQMNPNLKHADPVFINFHSIPPPLGSWNGYSQVTLLHIFRTPLPKNTSGGLPLHEHFFLKLLNDIMASFCCIVTFWILLIALYSPVRLMIEVRTITLFLLMKVGGIMGCHG